MLFEVKPKTSSGGIIIKDKWGLAVIDEYEFLDTNKGFEYADTFGRLYGENNKNIERHLHKFDPEYPDDSLIDVRSKFQLFDNPDVFEYTGENSESSTINANPKQCLFGFSQAYYIAKDQNQPMQKGDPERCASLKIEAGDDGIKHYQILIWLEETGSVQNEQEKVFEGTVILEVSGDSSVIGDYENGQITGKD